jgi:hypothetical protein
MIKKIFFISVILHFTLGLAQPKEDWKTLFNGENFNGWKITGGAGKIRINDGAIILNQTNNTTEHTFLYTKKKYKNFILEMDCKRDAKFYYGILFRAVKAPDTAHAKLYGYQVKVDHDNKRKWTGGIFDDFGNTWNWMYTLENDEVAQNALKPAGEWDHYRIEAIGDTIKVWVNGIPTAHLEDRKYKNGYIALKIHFLKDKKENEKFSAWIRNIKVCTKNLDGNELIMPLPIRTAKHKD